MANFLIIEVDGEFAILPSPEAQVMFFQLPAGGWITQPLPEEGWTASVWWWNDNPVEMILASGSWQPLPEGAERKLPTAGARLGWAYVLSSRATR